MPIPEYCDERAAQFFRRGYVGNSNGENGTPYSTHWDSTSGAKETKMILSASSRPNCAYCGNVGLPLQPYFRGSFTQDSDATVTGYTCICKDAMDEVQIKEQLQAMRAKHHAEETLLANSLPKVNKKALKAVAEARMKKLKKQIDQDFFLEDALESFSIKIK